MPESLETPPPKKRSHHKARTCPKCGSKKVAAIAYGYPGDMEAFHKAVEEGLIVPGGCLIGEDDPDWSCLSCHHSWGRRRG